MSILFILTSALAGMGGRASHHLMQRLFPLSSLLFASCLSMFAQDSLLIFRQSEVLKDSTHYVDSVIVTGNAQTKEFVILREMSLKPGSLITKDQLEYDKNRIYSLGLFNEVQLHTIPSSDTSATLEVMVTERWFIYPYPVLGIMDRDWSKIYYGLGLYHMNFRGRNEKLTVSFALGYDPWVALSYRNPFLSEEGTYYLEGRISTNVVLNKSLLAMTPAGNFDERHYSLSLTAGKRMGITHTAWVSAGYDVVRVSQYNPQTTISPTGEDQYPFLALGYTYDSRDLAEYPSSGSFLATSVTKFGLPSNPVNIIRYAADARQYLPLSSRAVLEGRIMGNLAAAGLTPSYNRVYFGYSERIRGHFSEVMEGESILGASAEFHYTLLRPVYFHINDLPPAFGVWRFGIVAAAFGDAGTVWFRPQPVAVNKFVKGYGVGIDFLLPYSTVIQLDYALNEVRRGEFILDVGSSF